MEHFFTDLWEMAKQAGPFGTLLMFFLYLRADKERRDVQSRHYESLESMQNMNEAWLKILRHGEDR